MAVDTTELSALTNPGFAAIVGEAIRGVRIDEKPLVTLKDLLPFGTVFGGKYSPIEGDTIMAISDLEKITARVLDVDGRFPLPSYMAGKVIEVFRLDERTPVAFKIRILDGKEITIRGNGNGYFSVSEVGIVVDNKLELKDDLLNGLKRVLTSQEKQEQERKLQSLRGFLTSPALFSDIRLCTDITTDYSALDTAKHTFKGFEEAKISEILGANEPITVFNLNIGQAFAYISGKEKGSSIEFRVFNGITEPKKSERYIVYGAVDDKIPMNSRRILRLSPKPLLIPYGDANFYLGAGQVYDSYGAMFTHYDQLVGEVIKVNMKIKQLLAQHLGVSIEKA